MKTSVNLKLIQSETVTVDRESHSSISAPTRSSMSVKDTDQQLVERVNAGDQRAFELLVIKYQGRVAGIVSRFMHDPADVKDVVQETFVKAYRALDRFRGDSAFYTWLYRIAVNCAKNFLAAAGRRPPATDIDLDVAEHISSDTGLQDIASPEKRLQKDQLLHLLNKTIQQLPEDLRVALTLREYDGLSYEEIADIMQCPVGTVRSRIFRARETVDAKLSPLLEGKSISK